MIVEKETVQVSMNGGGVIGRRHFLQNWPANFLKGRVDDDNENRAKDRSSTA